MEASEAADMSPLDVMLHIMRDKLVANDVNGAINAAKAAAPYLHTRTARPKPPEAEEYQYNGWVDEPYDPDDDL